ncbi:MAG: lamin tail domain-containing protein [Planctomycetota bacterium]|nr:lamin tail domain-containing protein [Planctomycetota bacterium]
MHFRAIVRVSILSLGLAAPAVAATPFQGPSVALAQATTEALLVEPPPQSGQVVITEFMKDPSSVSDARGEWIEVYNALPWRVNLEGWVLSDDSGATHVISTGGAGLRMAPGAYLVLGNNSDPALNGGVQVDYVWSSFSLSNGADQIVLSRADGTLVDRVAYDDGVLWPDLAGRSISLKLVARDVVMNDDPANWCHSSSAISATNADLGTPRRDNDACP